MARQVIWTKQALRKLNEIIVYLQNESSDQSANNFVDRVYDRIELVRQFPEAGRASKKKTARFVLVGKHHRMFYRKHGRKIIISYFFDTRQHPDKSSF